MKSETSGNWAGRLWKGFIAVRRFLWHLLYQREDDIVGFKTVSEPPLIDVTVEVSIESLDSGNVDALREFVHGHLANYPDAIRRFEDCLRRGFRGMIAQHQGKLIGCGWWVDNTIEHPQIDVLQLPIGPGDVYGFDLFIGQEFRGRHAGLQFLAACANYFHVHGYRRLFTIVRTDNLRSLKVHRQWGWQEIDRRAVYRIATLLIRCQGRWYWRNPVWF